LFGTPLFGTFVTLYLFTGGAAAGALGVMSAWSIVFHRREKQHTERLLNSFKSLMTRCYIIGASLLAFSILCLVWDLGSPQRVLLLFLRPHPTVLTFGSYALAIELLIALVLSVANLFSLAAVGGRIRKALEYLCCVVSLAVILYTGVFLATNASVPFWDTWTLPVLFLFSSLSAGVSLVLLIDYFIKDQTILLRAARPLQKIHVGTLIFELLSLACFCAAAYLNQAAQNSLALLLEPDMLSVAAVGVLGMGILIPLFLESYNLRVKPFRTIPVSDTVCLLGGLCLRYVIIQCGVH
jgi:formate-dependent nitrite reductase membrane component NrfD